MLNITKTQLDALQRVANRYQDIAEQTPLKLSDAEIEKNREMLTSPETKKAAIASFGKEIMQLRTGLDEKGQKVGTEVSVTFTEAVYANYGLTVNQFMKECGVNTATDSIITACDKLGVSNVNLSAIEELLLNYSSINAASFMDTKDFDPSFRFLIPEMILEAIRVGYLGSAKYVNWISRVQSVSNRKVTAPQIKDGDVMPYKVNEGASIPFGTLTFGQKEVKLFKVGIGFEMTDELIEEVSLDLMQIFLQQVGVKMGIGADTEAIDVLINGDQGDGSESAPVVGVQDIPDGFQHFDLDNVFGQMDTLAMPANRMVGKKEELIADLNESKQDRDRETVMQYAMANGAPSDMWAFPDNQIMYLNTQNAMAKLQFKGMMVERERDPSTQKERMYVTDFIGFLIIKRDARVIQDRSVTFAANPFPPYMDIFSYIAEPFKE